MQNQIQIDHSMVKGIYARRIGAESVSTVEAFEVEGVDKSYTETYSVLAANSSFHCQINGDLTNAEQENALMNVFLLTQQLHGNKF